MWQYNFDYLCHSDDFLMHLHRRSSSDHKYIDKYEKNGKTVYVYETPYQRVGRSTEYSINHPISSAFSGTKLWYPGQQNELRKTNPANSVRSGVQARTVSKAQNARANEIAKSTSATTAYNKAQQVINAQNARQNEINKSVNKTKPVTPAPQKTGLSAKQEIAVNKAVAKSMDYINKTFGTNLGPEAATTAEKERVKRAVEESRDRAVKDQNARDAAISRSVDATRAASQLANARKQEEERRRASNTVERAQNARESAIAKSINTSKQISNARKQEYERMVSGSTRRENALRDDPYISDLLNKELKGYKEKNMQAMRDAYKKVYDKVKNDPKVTSVTKENLEWIIENLEKETNKR